MILDMHKEKSYVFLSRGMHDLYKKTYTDRHGPNPKYL